MKTRRKNQNIMATILAMILMLTPLFGFADDGGTVANQSAPISDISVILDKNQTTIVEGRTLVVVRAFSEAVNLPISWDQADKLVIIDQGDVQVVIKIGDNVIHRLVGDTTEKIVIDQPARVINGKTVIPAAAAAKALGLNTAYDPITKQVAIFAETNPLATSGGNPSDLPEPTQPANDNNSSQPPQQSQSISSDLSAINSKSIKKVIIDGTEVKFQHINNKTQVSIPELKRSLIDWRHVGEKDYEGKLIFFSRSIPLPNTAYDVGLYDVGISMLIWPDSGKMWIGRHYMEQLDPLAKVNGQYYMPLDLLLKVFKVDFNIKQLDDGDILDINTYDRGTINGISSRDQIWDFYNDPSAKVLGKERPYKYFSGRVW